MAAIKKIAFVIPSFRAGGAEKMLLTAANYLCRRHEVHIVFLKEAGPFLDALSPEIKRWNINNGSIYFSVSPIRKLIREINPDIIFPWMGYLNAYLAFFKPLFNKKIHWVCRESSIPSLMNGHYKFSFLYRFFYRFYNRYDAIVCQSAYMAEDLINNFHVKAGKITVINNPVDFDAIADLQKEDVSYAALPENHYQLLYVGGLHPWKRVHLLVDAMKLLPENYRLTILGEGGEEKNILQSIRNFGLESRISIIHGFSNPFPYYSIASCLILCSKFEGFPNVLTEAMATGCPVIGYNIRGGANEILSGYGGTVITGDIEELATGIMKLCEARDTDKERIIREGRERYNMQKIMAQYETLLDKL